MITDQKRLMLPALKAGIKVPPDLNDYCADEYAHWYLFCGMQLNSAIPTPGIEWENAVLISKLTEEQANIVTWNQMLSMGFQIGLPNLR